MSDRAEKGWCELSPIGAHKAPSGIVRYAIWEWRDAVNVKRIPCGIVQQLASGLDFADWRRSRATAGMLRVAQLAHVADRDGKLTELGSAVRRKFLSRQGVKEGWETAHGLRRKRSMATR